MWGIFIMSERIRERAISSSFLRHTTTARVVARSSAENGLAGCSSTITAKPHEYFNHTMTLARHDGSGGGYDVRRVVNKKRTQIYCARPPVAGHCCGRRYRGRSVAQSAGGLAIAPRWRADYPTGSGCKTRGASLATICRDVC